MDLKHHLACVVDAVQAWESSWGPYAQHPSLAIDTDRLTDVLEAYTERLGGNYPFFHPRYAGQMLKPPHPAAVVGYLAAQLINPNNHALDGGPPTGAMEKEVVRDLAKMVGFPDDTLGHLTGGGTVANLEALFVARKLHPGKGVAYSSEAHYTHSRMGEVLGLTTEAIPTDAAGRLDLDALEEVLRTGRIGTVVVTAGTTGLGAVDPIADAVPLCRTYGCRIHVDAAYGGFFALLAQEGADSPLTHEVRRHFRAIAGCDSIAIDPHKHGLQPYGCGTILFRDPSVGRFYKHDSPYTYFTSSELHLGEISLECSRAGAAAGALWVTLQLFPLKAEAGLGPVLAACIRAAQRWHALLEKSLTLTPYHAPELDIVTYFPTAGGESAADIDRHSAALFTAGMEAEEPVFLSVLRVPAERLRRVWPELSGSGDVRILRSVLMKPEHERWVDDLHARVTALAERSIHPTA